LRRALVAAAQAREGVGDIADVSDRQIAALEAGATKPPKRRPLEMTRLLLGAEQRVREHVLEVLIAGSSPPRRG
jgi:hypothetical protein